MELALRWRLIHGCLVENQRGEEGDECRSGFALESLIRVRAGLSETEVCRIRQGGELWACSFNLRSLGLSH